MSSNTVFIKRMTTVSQLKSLKQRQTDRHTHTHTQNKSVDRPKYGGRFVLNICSTILPFLFNVMSYAPVLSGRPLLLFLRNILSSFLYSVLPEKNHLLRDFDYHHHWLDSPWWALAFLRSCAHSSLLRATFFQFLTPRILIS